MTVVINAFVVAHLRILTGVEASENLGRRAGLGQKGLVIWCTSACVCVRSVCVDTTLPFRCDVGPYLILSGKKASRSNSVGECTGRCLPISRANFRWTSRPSSRPSPGRAWPKSGRTLSKSVFLGTWHKFDRQRQHSARADPHLPNLDRLGGRVSCPGIDQL